MGSNYVITPDGNFIGIDSGDLYHWGIKGMKWGVRRYQNKDGSLTNAGRKRYESEADKGDYNQTKSDGTRFKQTKKGNVESLKPDAKRYAREDDEALRSVVNESKNLTSNLKSMNDASIRRAKNKRTEMDLSNMSDKEMRDKINRALLEKQYRDMFAPQTTTKGREYLSNILDTAGSVLTVGSTALGIAISMYTLKSLLGTK